MSTAARAQDPARRTRQFLDSAGLTLGFSYTFESIASSHESPARPLSAGLTDLELRWRPKTPGPLGNGEFIAVYSVYAPTRGLSTPDLQCVSSLAAPSFRRWREAYFEMPFLNAARLKVGKVDANTEFAVVEAGGDLSNASAGVSPTLFTMPSYPDGALSANLFAAAGRGISFGGGVYRSPGGGAYYVGEAGGRWRNSRPGRVAAGVWRQQAGAADADAVPSNTGSYFIVEQTVVRLGKGSAIEAFARLSTADESVAPASLHNMAGVSWSGFGSRVRDSAGFALLHLAPALEGVPLKAEQAYEVYYKLSLSSYLDMKFDLQQVRHPGGLADAPSYRIAAVRLLFRVSSSGEVQP